MRKLTPISQKDWRVLEEKERLRHRRAMARLDARRALFQSTCCPHKNTGFIPDPSGNNDSYYECIDCGKVL